MNSILSPKMTASSVAPRPRSVVAFSRPGVLTLGALAGLGLLVCGLGYVITLPRITPGMLVTGSFAGVATSRLFALTQTCSILTYACALLPLTVMFSVRQFRAHPFGIVFAGCAMAVALLIEILNNLPGLAMQLLPAPVVAPPAEFAPYVRQMEWTRYASQDVAAFTMIFVAGLVYAAIYRRRRPLLAYAFLGSVAAFLLHVPFLWISPAVAVFLMGLSICLPAATPVILARLTVEP